MTVIDIFSGFLGAGKTTLIKKLISEAYKDEKIVLIENEFGEIGIDGGFLKEAGIQINEMNSGCICCSLVGDFEEALKKVMEEYRPDRILIEPSGVGKLSDVIKAVESVHSDNMKLGCFVTVADATKCKMYMKNFGEFYNNQIENAGTIILSRTGNMSDEKIHEALHLLKEKNQDATIVTTPWDSLTGEQILEAMSGHKHLIEECPHCREHHHHDEHCCDHDHDHHEHHHHHHDEHCCDHEHHHHDEHCCDHDHHHHHHDEHCCDHEHHHHHHHADDVFTSIGIETVKKYTKEEIREILSKLHSFGQVLRAKGIVMGKENSWIHFDYVPEEIDVREGGADYTGRICVIGADLDEQGIKGLF